MPVKTLRFSFDLPMQELLAYIQHSGADMKIDVLGTAPKPPRQARLAGPRPKLLEGPKKIRKPGSGKNSNPKRRPLISAQERVLDRLVKHKGENCLASDMKIMIEKYDFHGSTSSVSLTALKGKGLAENVGPGLWRATPKALKEAHKARPKDTNGVAEPATA